MYSRTRDFINDFAASLSRFDQLILLEIYPARELPIDGVTSAWLLDKIDLEDKQISSKKNLAENVLKLDSQVIVMIGAGDIGELVEVIKNALDYEN